LDRKREGMIGEYHQYDRKGKERGCRRVRVKVHIKIFKGLNYWKGGTASIAGL
jgi:hypothetical protein